MQHYNRQTIINKPNQSQQQIKLLNIDLLSYSKYNLFKMQNQLQQLTTTQPFTTTSNKLLCNRFSLKRNQPQSVSITLFKQGLELEYDDGDTKFLTLSFEIKFTLLRQQDMTPGTQIIGEPYGIKLQKSPNHQQITIFNKNKSILLEWRDELRKLINQRGFHELYKPSKKIGKGNSATVYLAERLQDKTKMAIKAFSKQLMANEPKGKESLVSEIQTMRRFDHSSLMKLYEVFETDNSYYLAIQFLDGGQLFQKVNTRRFNLMQIKKILKKLVEGLMEMHRQNIIHRDLKPQNLIFRTPNDYGDIVIADYGLATKADQQEYIFVRCGTPGYVAPEIINFKGKSGQSTISDIFSLGVIAHILATGRSPFSGKQYQQVLNQNRNANFNFNLQIYKYVQSSLLDLIKRMVTVSPEQRIKTEQILNHQFFTTEEESESIPNEDIPNSQLQNERNHKRGMEKIIDSRGSFIIPKPQILQGNDNDFISMNNVGSSNSVSCSPQSIKISSFVGTKRDRETSSPMDSQFKVGNRKTMLKARVNLNDLSDKKDEINPLRLGAMSMLRPQVKPQVIVEQEEQKQEKKMETEDTV